MTYVGLLIASFFLGGIVSVLIVTGLYLITGKFLPVTDQYSIWQQFIHAFIVVALSEEFSKFS